MKLAVIVPTGYLTATNTLHSGFHMVLGQHLEDPKYRKHYSFLAANGHSILIDNGAAEPDDPPVPFDKIVAFAQDLDADWVILPDKLYDAAWTVEHSTYFSDLVPEERTMIVPQGKDPEEWQDCFTELSRKINFTRVGIPKVCEAWPGGRRALVEWLTVPRRCIHYLGVYSKPIAEVEEAARLGIGSMDTGAPVAYAQKGEVVRDDIPRISLDWDGEIPHWDLVEQSVKILRKAAYYAYYN